MQIARSSILFLFAFLPLLLHGAERWKMQYYYSKISSALDIRDIQCPSATRCIAAGVVVDKNEHEKGLVLVTSDGGKQWVEEEVRELPVSLFFLNESLGWMATERGVWSTEESGRGWKKLEGLKGILRVHFLTPTHGYAIGFPKLVYETVDGGKKWSKLEAADTPATTPKETVYECITFLGQHGVIVGRVSNPANEGLMPIWMNPGEGRYRRQRQSNVILLETEDGGKTWQSSITTAFGHLTKLRLTNDGNAIVLFAYEESYSLASSVVKISLGKLGTHNLFGEKNRAVTDFSLLPDGGAILASVEPPGNSNQVPIPGKLKMLRSKDMKVWSEDPIDYRAVAQHATLAAVDALHMWVATDTGMILKLLDTENSSH